MRIQHNILAMNAYRNYNTNTSALAKNLEKLSSGYKINRAGDDAAGLAISEKMRAQITGLNAAQKNVKDGISLVKTAEGAMQEIQDMLNRMDYLATQSANGTYDNEVDRANLQKEVDALKSEINRIADSANFNGIKLLDGKTGLNTSAIQFGEMVKGVQGSTATTTPDSDVIKGTDANFAAAFQTTSGLHGMHLNAVKAEVKPSFAIDLSGVELSYATAAASVVGTAITVSIGSVNIKLTIGTGTKADIKATQAGTINATRLASLVAKKFNSTIKASAGASKTLGAVGQAVFLAKASNGKITFEYKGALAAANATAVTATTVSSAAASSFNTKIGIGANVNVEVGASATKMKLDHVHNVHGITRKEAVVGDKKQPAGITLDVDQIKDNLKDGSVLTIDGKKFAIQLGSTAPTVASASVINLNGVASADIAKTLVTQLAGKKTDNFEIRAVTGTKGTMLHIDQLASKVDVAGAPKFTTKESLQKLFSISTPTTTTTGTNVTEVKAYTQLTINADKLKAGDQFVMSVKGADGKVTDTIYTFVNKKTDDSAANQIVLGENNASAIANLKAALGNAVATATVGGGQFADNVLGIRGAGATYNDSMVSFKGVGGLTLQIGDTSDAFNQLKVVTGDLHTDALGLKDMSIADPTSAAAAIQTIKNAINSVSSIRGDLGAIQNRLEHTANNLSVMAENIQDAESTIRDTDVAEEMMAYTKNNILVQSAQAMLAQANAVPQGVLQLLG